MSKRADNTSQVALERIDFGIRTAASDDLPGSVWGRSVKRALDLVGAMLLLAVVFPACLLIAILIKLDSRGPVLFRSPRIGRHGRPLGMLKFRTMCEAADEQRQDLLHLSDASGGVFKMREDPRLTRVGRVLRSLSVDELPQLIHVIRGEMSLVGPRPLPPEEDDLLSTDEPRRRARPGITGAWQVAGSWRIPLPEMTLLERDYLSQWSIWLDLRLLALTAVYVVRRRGV